LGANPEDLIQKLKKFRESKKGVRPPDFVQKRILLNKASKNRNKKQRENEYCNEGYQNALHLIQNFPYPKVLQYLIGLNRINVNHQDYLSRTPLHLFAKHANETM